MATSRLRAGEVLAAVGGVVLLVGLALDWYGVAAGSAPAGGAGSVSRNAWQAFDVLDVLLALLGLAGLVVLVLNVVHQSPAVPVAAEVLTTVFALFAAMFVAYRLLDQPGPNDAVGVEPGAYLGLLATLAVLYGAFRALRDESGRAMREPHVTLRPAPRGVAATPPAATMPATADPRDSVEPDASPAADPLATPASGSPAGGRKA